MWHFVFKKYNGSMSSARDGGTFLKLEGGGGGGLTSDLKWVAEETLL